MRKRRGKGGEQNLRRTAWRQDRLYKEFQELHTKGKIQQTGGNWGFSLVPGTSV